MSAWMYGGEVVARDDDELRDWLYDAWSRYDRGSTETARIGGWLDMNMMVWADLHYRVSDLLDELRGGMKVDTLTEWLMDAFIHAEHGAVELLAHGAGIGDHGMEARA